MLYHFSDDPDICRFDPRPSRLGKPFVWAISAEHARLYLFPRNCPRIVVWAKQDSSAVDQQRWLGSAACVAFVETKWMMQIRRLRLYRYKLPIASFQPLDDVGMHVSDTPVTPKSMMPMHDLPAQLGKVGVKLCAVPSLVPLKSVWDTSLHASGIRLRHATGWN